MMMLKFQDKLLILLFFVVLLTSLWANNVYLLVMFAAATYIQLPYRSWDKVCSFLLLFSLAYAMMAIMYGNYGSGFILISYVIAPVAFYRFGKWLMSIFRDDTVRQKLFLAIVLCYSISLFILTVKDTAIVGIVNTSRVMLEDVSDSSSLAATLYGLMASIGIGCISCIFAKRQPIILRLSFIILTLFSLFVVIHLVNRTGVVVFFSCFILSMLVATKLKIVKMIPLIVLVFILGLFLVKSGVINEEILTAYQNREVSSTSNAYELGGRSDIWSDALHKLVTHPLGWSHVEYAHNLWIDIARAGGWLPLLFFILATIVWIKNSLRLIKRPTTFILLLLSINIAMFLASFVEPVIDASMLFFSLMMMVWGCTAVVSQEKINTVQ